MIGLTVPPTYRTTQAYLSHLQSCRNFVPGTYIIDLTYNAISMYNGKSIDKVDTTSGSVSSIHTNTILKTLPLGPKFRLFSVLKKVCAEYHIGPQAIHLGEFDSAFELQSAEGE